MSAAFFMFTCLLTLAKAKISALVAALCVHRQRPRQNSVLLLVAPQIGIEIDVVLLSDKLRARAKRVTHAMASELCSYASVRTIDIA